MGQAIMIKWPGGQVSYYAGAEEEIYFFAVLADGWPDVSVSTLVHYVVLPLLNGQAVSEEFNQYLNEECQQFARFVRDNLPNEERIRQGILVRRDLGAGVEVVPVEMAAMRPRTIFEILERFGIP